jgi:hypothetical protein
MSTPRSLSPARLSSALQCARRRPAFALYLLALAAFPFKWLSPFTYAQAGWIDVLLAVATAAWVGTWLFSRKPICIRPVHLALAGYLLWTCVSGVVTSEPRSVSAQNVLIAFELAALMGMTSDFGRSDAGRRLIAQAIFLVVVITAVETAVGLALFYAGAHSSLVAGYSSYFKSSSLYTRVSAGFYSPPLLGSFCIFASGVVAMRQAGLSARMRRAAQIALWLIVLTTVSRAVIGFAVAFILRCTQLTSGRARGRQIAALIGIAGVLAMILLTVVPLSLDPLKPSSTQSTTNSRLKTIETSATTFSHHLLAGAGPGSLTAVQDGAPVRAHFTPLNVAATTGLPAVIALTTFVALLWRRRGRPTDAAIWTALLGLAIDGLGQDIEHFRHVWLMLGLADADRAPGGKSWTLDPLRRLRSQSSASAERAEPEPSAALN